jgi:hypothetical protein
VTTSERPKDVGVVAQSACCGLCPLVVRSILLELLHAFDSFLNSRFVALALRHPESEQKSQGIVVINSKKGKRDNVCVAHWVVFGEFLEFYLEVNQSVDGNALQYRLSI